MSGVELKTRLRARLRPIESWSAGEPPGRSDFDLNPEAVPDDTPLRGAAVLVPLVFRPEGVTVILTRRADTLASHTGQIAFPGGRIEPGETAVEAAVREAEEEIALSPTRVEVLGLGDAYRTGSGFLVTPVVGWLDHPPPLTPDPSEVAELFEAPWDFLMDVANHRHDHYDRDGQPRRWFWAMPWGERYIWGVTAGLLRALCDRLSDEAA